MFKSPIRIRRVSSKILKYDFKIPLGERRVWVLPGCPSAISNVWKYLVYLRTHIWLLCSAFPFHGLQWDKICKDVLDFISHTRLFKHLLCIRNQGLHWSLGKNVFTAWKSILCKWHCCTAEVSSLGAGEGARLQGLVPSFAIQSHAVPF